MAADELAVLRVTDVEPTAIASLLGRYGLNVEQVGTGKRIPASFWGDSEAGISGSTVYVRPDTPIHSMLHEASHVICMTPARRRELHRDAGGDDLEESAVCYLEILLAAELEEVGSERLMKDMDSWGYSFRLGNTRRWFSEDAEDARAFLVEHGIIDDLGQLTGASRGDPDMAC